jgi:hypothetical protein
MPVMDIQTLHLNDRVPTAAEPASTVKEEKTVRFSGENTVQVQQLPSEPPLVKTKKLIAPPGLAPEGWTPSKHH